MGTPAPQLAESSDLGSAVNSGTKISSDAQDGAGDAAMENNNVPAGVPIETVSNENVVAEENANMEEIIGDAEGPDCFSQEASDCGRCTPCITCHKFDSCAVSGGQEKDV